mmetsp:Transcript_30186/g.86474  ORF Transcript_30186/g.86474 Transcript_30186/m.86474 type:complete len:339 (-) Transcript_30186:82-1098(-)
MLRRLLVELLGIYSVLASADREASDSFVLAQWSYRVSPAVLESGPSGGDVAPLAISTAAPQAAKTDGFQDILRSLDEITSSTSKNTKSVNPDMTATMRFFQALCESVKSDAFMGSMTHLYHSWVADTKDYSRTVRAAIEKYAFLSRTAKDKEMPALTAQLFNNATNLTKEVNSLMHKALDATLEAIPQTVRESLDGSIGGDSAQDPALLALLPSNLTQSELCAQAEAKLTHVRELSELGAQGLKGVNATEKMLPMLRDYLEKNKPDIAGRLMYLMEDHVDSIYAVGAENLEVQEVMLSELRPILKARMGCELTMGSSGARRGLGLLALLAAAVAWLEH